MFNFSSSLRIYLCVDPTDMRKAFNGLYAIAKHQLDLNPMDGSLSIEMKPEALSMLLNGIDLKDGSFRAWFCR